MNLKNLPKDIYALLENPKDITVSDRANLVNSLSKVIADAVSTQDKSGLRMSNYGSPCKRQLWYKVNKPELAEPIEGKALFKFLYGHVIEALVLWLARLAGYKVEGEQDELVYEGIVGHRDAVINGVLVDVKSANARGMEKFRSHRLDTDDPFGYLDQLSLYGAASKDDPLVEVKKEAAFVAVDKENGDIVVDVYKTKEISSDDVAATRNMLSLPEPPARGYSSVPDGRSGNEALPFQCNYCQYKHTCWPGLRGFLYSNGIRWLTKVIRTPDVPEISPKA